MTSFSEVYDYTPRPINPDEGVTIRIQQNGRQVITYMGMPGLYLDGGGNEVSDEEARDLGFDLESERREAMLRKRIKDATADIRKQEAQIEHDLRQELAGKPSKLTPFSQKALDEQTKIHPQILAVDPDDQELITSRNGQGFPRETADFYMDHIGAGLWRVIDRESKAVLVERLPVLEAIHELVRFQKEKLAG